MSIEQTASMVTSGVTYEAKQDNVGALVPLHHKRRYLVIKYRDGKYCYIVGMFSSMHAAEARARILNRPHLSAADIAARQADYPKARD